MGWLGHILKKANPFKIAGDAIDYVTGTSAQKKANQTNIKLAQDNRDFQERMSNTEVTRRVNDLKNAGLNPMLAYDGAASSPNTSAATVQPEGANRLDKIMSLNSARIQALQRDQIQAQTDQIRAQTGLTNTSREGVQIDNDLKAWDVPYSAGNAANRSAKLNAEADAAMQQVRNLKLAWDQNKQDLELKRRLQDKLVEAQELANQASRLDMPEKETSAKWYSGPMGGGGRAANMLKDIFQIMKEIRR